MKRSPSLRTKVIFISLASLILLGFCLTLATIYAVNARKREIVRHAQQLVEFRAEQLSRHIARLFDEEKAADLEALRKTQRFKQAIQFILTDPRDNQTLAVSLVYPDGRVESFVKPEAADRFRIEVGRAEGARLAEARRAVLHGDRSEGEVVVRYVPGVLLGQIREESRRITLSLLGLAAVLTVFLCLTFVLLWHIFRRHLERERAQEQLDRMAYIGTLASGLAHEIRNPLNALSINLDIIGEEMSDPRPDSAERTRRVLDLLKSEIGRLNATLTGFLDFALPRHGQMKVADIVALLHETAALLEPEMRKRDIKYHFTGERSCATFCDPAALRQVFWNVLLNAIQAVEASEERRIEARCNVEGGECRIEIRDSGPGVPPAQREKVFEIFHSTRPGGSGFGLPIARQIVARHDGSIWIDSLDGWGCVVHITIPLKVGLAESKYEGDRRGG